VIYSVISFISFFVIELIHWNTLGMWPVELRSLTYCRWSCFGVLLCFYPLHGSNARP